MSLPSMPTYLYSTSNDDLVHPVKTLLSGQNPDWPNPSWQVTQRIQMVSRNYNDKKVKIRPEIY